MNTKELKASYTPGPWEVEHSGYGDFTVIAKCGWRNKDGSEFNPTIINRTSFENARLIATSPELLEALKAINYAFYVKGTRKDMIEVMSKTKDLIRKAESRDIIAKIESKGE